MVSVANAQVAFALGEFWDVLLSVAVIIGGYLIFSPRFLGKYFFPKKASKHCKLSEENIKTKDLGQEDFIGAFESNVHCALSEDASVAQDSTSEVDTDFPPIFETDDLMSLWRSSPSGLDEAVAAQLDDGLADMASPSDWGMWSQDDPDKPDCDDLDEEFWSAPPPVSINPAADDEALDSAIATGDSELAGAALGVGAHRCGALWACEGLCRLRESGLPLSMPHAVELAQCFGGEARADLAADLWSQRHPVEPAEELKELQRPAVSRAAIPEPELYTAVLEVCARCMDFEAAAKVAARAGWRSPASPAGRRAMLALARWLARRQQSAQAWECYEEVRRQGHGADLTTHKAILTAVVRGTDMTQAAVVFEDLVASGLEPDEAAFSAMIGGYCAAGALPKAMQYLEHMRSGGITPTTTLFDMVITGCLCCDALTVLEQVLSGMKVDGVPPSSATVEALVRYHGRGGNVESAVAISEELPQRHNFELDGHAYGAVISVCLAGSRLDLALATVRLMISKGLTPSARCYESLILGCMRQGDIGQAVLLVDDAIGSSTEEVFHDPHAERSFTGNRPTRQLEPQLLEELLRFIGRKRQSARLGVPLMNRLEVAGVEVSEQLGASLHRAAELEGGTVTCFASAAMQHRRTEHENWRNLIR